MTKEEMERAKRLAINWRDCLFILFIINEGTKAECEGLSQVNSEMKLVTRQLIVLLGGYEAYGRRI